MDLNGCSAVVTGAASGLGAATAAALSGRGARVLLFDRAPGVHGVADALAGASAFVGDVADEGDVAAAIAAAQGWGPLRVLVNCAGIVRMASTVSRRGEPFPLGDAELVLRVNLVGTFNWVRLAVPAMLEAGPDRTGERGVIVNTGSTSAVEGRRGQAAYAASKAAVAAMTVPLARELGPHGIRVATLVPGLFETAIMGVGPEREALRARLQEHLLHPSRPGDPREFAAAVLAVVDQPILHGVVLRLDGGARMPD